VIFIVSWKIHNDVGSALLIEYRVNSIMLNVWPSSVVTASYVNFITQAHWLFVLCDLFSDRENQSMLIT